MRACHSIHAAWRMESDCFVCVIMWYVVQPFFDPAHRHVYPNDCCVLSFNPYIRKVRCTVVENSQISRQNQSGSHSHQWCPRDTVTLTSRRHTYIAISHAVREFLTCVQPAICDVFVDREAMLRSLWYVCLSVCQRICIAAWRNVYGDLCICSRLHRVEFFLLVIFFSFFIFFLFFVHITLKFNRKVSEFSAFFRVNVFGETKQKFGLRILR